MGGEIEEGEKAAEGATLEEEGHGESEGGVGGDEGGGVEEGHGEPWDDIPVREVSLARTSILHLIHESVTTLEGLVFRAESWELRYFGFWVQGWELRAEVFWVLGSGLRAEGWGVLGLVFWV
jgi:hypothetical protein